jgi:2-keto-4-pentenoate hydratase/2-oxohepta-3-ene-1,7-dioic acid hydratase in catechol pathway
VRLFRVPRGGAPSTLVEVDGVFRDAGARDPLELCAAPAVDSAWPEVDAPEDVLVPIDPARVGKILCLGKNFRAHAEEFGEEVPAEPLFFGKFPETLVPHRAVVSVPRWYDQRVDHEAELALVIGADGADIALERAFDHVAGYTVANDLTARTLQAADRKKGHPWLRAKNLDRFCPLGPCLVPRAELDVSDLSVTARVRTGGDWETRQKASTREWIVDIPHALAWLSKHLTLRRGDVILMGTPAGVGPLADGDEVVCAVEGIGELATTIARPT